MTEATLTCANHPTVETRLRCNRCGKPICSKCAMRTPVGYRCKECVREQQQVFETAVWYDYPIALGISGVSAFFAVWLLTFLGIFGLFVAPAIGVGGAEAVRRAMRGHRGRYLPLAAAGGAILGALPFVIQGVVGFIFSLRGLQSFLGGAFTLLWPIVYGFLIVSTLYWRLRGIRM